jgi:imidazolonepropionase-like amidohydrolase
MAASSPAPRAAVRAYVGGTVVAAPEAAPIADGVVIVAGTRIVAVGPRDRVAVPPAARVVDCRGATVLAAFWNAHVHFNGPPWTGAAHVEAASLEGALRAMLGRWGFAHVFDTGSRLSDTGALRARIERGEIAGPQILTVGRVYVAEGGQPVYVPFPLPQLATPEMGRAAATADLDGGADAIKLMTVSVVAHPPAPVMPVAIVRAVAETAHARGALVFAHPTNRAGVLAARDGGVDILAHTAPAGGPWSADDARSLVAAGMSLVPTLSLWRRELEARDPAAAAQYESVAIDQVRVFAAAGGTLLFGTDVGYRPEYDTTPEHELLARAGLSFAARLAMLTTAPAARFHARRSGRLAADLDADLVVLDGDPTTSPGAFAQVRCTVRRGATIYRAAPDACGPADAEPAASLPGR